MLENTSVRQGLGVGGVKHPAKYSDCLFEVFSGHIMNQKRLLDPMAGTGKITRLREFGFEGLIVCNELEPEWAAQATGADLITMCDAKKLPFVDGYFDAICTSPTYGNRMADCHNAKDNSRRNTYTHVLGRKLHKENTGQMQWGEKYREHHREIWQEVYRVSNGIFVLNISDHIRKGEIVEVSEWHKEAVLDIGFNLIDEIRVKTPRLRFGANGNKRVDHENVFVFSKGE